MWSGDLHGSYNIEVSGNILLASLVGSWNTDTAKAFAQEFKLKAQPLLGKSWGHLVILDDWELGVPGMQPIIEELVAWCIECGLVRAAHVYSPSMIKKYQLNKMVLEKIEDFQRHSFSDLASATAWLSAEGFELSTD